MSNHKSWIWQHANRVGDKAICKVCKCQLTCSGGSTSSISRHVKNIHGITSNASSDEHSQHETVRATHACDNVAVPSCSKERAEEINMAVAKMIATSQMPMSFCCSEGFKFVSDLFPGYTPIKDEAMKRRLHILNDEVENVIRSELEKVDFVAFTSDFWSSVANDSYLTITAHTINNEWAPKTYTLDTCEIAEKHTAENIAQKITDSKDRWILCDVVAIVTDNAINITNAVRLLQYVKHEGLSCAAHSLQLVINKAMANEGIQELIGLASKIVGHFKHSPKATQELKARQDQLGLPVRKLIQCNKTRWNSTYSMLERLMANRSAILNVLTDRSVTQQSTARKLELTEVQWHSIEQFVELLYPPFLVTDLLCTEHSSVSMVRPLIFQWKEKYLKINELDDIISTNFKTVECFEIESRFQLNLPGNITAGMVAGFLDPRYKDLDHETENMKMDIRLHVKGLLRTISQSSGDPTIAENDTSLPPKKKNKFEAFYGRAGSACHDINNQWTRYVSEAQIIFDMDPFAGGEKNKANIQILRA